MKVCFSEQEYLNFYLFEKINNIVFRRIAASQRKRRKSFLGLDIDDDVDVDDVSFF